MDDFPLSQELKDEIYGYLLHGGPYQQATNILNVNKAIGNNAAQYFYKHNTFVLVRFDCPGFLTHLHTLGVSMVADDKLENFSMHAYAIDVDWEWDVRPLLSTTYQTLYADAGRVLLLERDLPRLWSIIRLICLHSIPNRVYVRSREGRKLSIEAQDTNPCVRTYRSKLRVSAQDHRYRSLTPAEKKAFLQPLDTITGAGYRLNISGFDNIVAARTKTVTSPERIWLRAHDWDRIDCLYELKGIADLNVRRGHLINAGLQYDLLRRYTKLDPLEVAEAVADPSRVDAYIRDQHLKCDLTMSALQCGLARIAGGQTTAEQFDYVSSQLEPWWAHFNGIRNILTSFNNRFQITESLTQVVNFLQTLSPTTPEIVHDIGVLQAALQNNLYAGDHGRIIQALSIRPLPLPIFDMRLEILQPTRPADLLGWQDINHLAALTDRMKAAINRLQRREGFPLSEW